MNIIFFIGSLNGGGAEWQCLLNANALSKKGHSVILCVLSDDLVYLKRIENLSSSLKIISLCNLNQSNKFKKILQLIRAVWNLRRCVNESKSEVIYSWLEIPQFISYFATIFKKTILVWAVRDAEMSEYKGCWKIRLFIKINKFFCYRVRGLISNSNAGLTYYIKKYKYRVSKAAVIYNLVDKMFFSTEASVSVKNFFSLVVVSRLVPIKKNIEELFKALSILKTYRSGYFKLLIVGSGTVEYESELKALSKNLMIDNDVVWCGRADNPVFFYKEADLFVLPSLYEGLSNSLLEAIASKALCLSTDVGSSAQFLDDDLIIKSKDAHAIAEKILWASNLSTDQMNHYIEKSYAQVKNRCSETVIIQQLEEFFLSI